MFPLINQGFDSTLEPSYFSKTYSDKSGGPELINKTITENGTYNAKEENVDGYSSVTVNVAPPVPEPPTGVRLFDYDGTLLHTYTNEEFAALEELPAAPEHDGLISRGWNWSLADAKEQVEFAGCLDMGHVYNPEHSADGKTLLTVYFDSREKSAPFLNLCVDGSVDIDWGDGSAHDTLTGSSLTTRKAVQHSYGAAGTFTISLSATGSFSFYGDTASDTAFGTLFTYTETATPSDVQNKAFQDILREVVIGDGITSINRCVFLNCTELTSVIIPDNIVEIGTRAFCRCRSLSSVVIPDSVQSIGSSAFGDCELLSSVVIPDGVTEIATNTFKGCTQFSAALIPNSITEINNGAFANCSNITRVSVPRSVTYFGGFADSGLRTMPKHQAVRLGNFGGLDLPTFEFPSSVKQLYGTFQRWTSLRSITIPDTVTLLSEGTFEGCTSLVHVELPNTSLVIQERVFYGCTALTSITIPAKNSSPGSNAFYGCTSLTSVSMTGSSYLYASVFRNCSHLVSVALPDYYVYNTGMDSYAFSGCHSLRTIKLSNRLTKISSYAFENCHALASITIPSTVTSIETSAFANCYALPSITIPSNVTSIKSYAFSNCYGLGLMRFLGSTPPAAGNATAFDSLNQVGLIDFLIPLGSYEAYTTANYYLRPSSDVFWIEYATYEDGESLPATSQDETRTYAWYATIEDWRAETNPITVGNGNEIYCRSATV